jgi:membrane-anchored glycerophosphoryl diester phosphodiesterase (GDPDase)
MTNKILLAKNVSRGNLISPNYEQSYLVYFLPKVVEDGKVVLCEKTRLEIVAPSSNGEAVVKSYQMIFQFIFIALLRPILALRLQEEIVSMP